MTPLGAKCVRDATGVNGALTIIGRYFGVNSKLSFPVYY